MLKDVWADALRERQSEESVQQIEEYIKKASGKYTVLKCQAGKVSVFKKASE